MEKRTRNLLILAGAITAGTVGVLIWAKSPSDKSGTGAGATGAGATGAGSTGAGSTPQVSLDTSTQSDPSLNFQTQQPQTQQPQTQQPQTQQDVVEPPKAPPAPAPSTVYVNEFALRDNKNKSLITATAKISAAALYRIQHYQAGAQDLAELPNVMSVAVAMEQWWHYWWAEGRTDIDHSPFNSNWIRQHATMPTGFMWGRSAGENALLAYAYFQKYGKSWILNENPPASRVIDAPTPI